MARTIIFYILLLGVIILLFRACNKWSREIDVRVEKARIERLTKSGYQTFIFKHPSGDTLYATNYVALGTPQLTFGYDINGKSDKTLKWYFVEDYHITKVRDDKFRQIINPNCILVGIKK
jgi:hypothetical protein